MTPCDGTDYSKMWCCGTSTECCGTNDQVPVPTDIYFTPTFTSVISTSNSEPTGTNANLSSGKDSSVQSLSTGGKAGVGIGVAVGAIAIIGLLVFFLRQKRKSKTVARVFHPRELLGSNTAQELEMTRVHEKPAGAQDSRHELSGGPVYAANREWQPNIAMR